MQCIVNSTDSAVYLYDDSLPDVIDFYAAHVIITYLKYLALCAFYCIYLFIYLHNA